MSGRRTLVRALLGSAAVLAVALAIRSERRAISADLAATRDLHAATYVGSSTCRRCHEDHYRSWGRTFHRTMTRDATPEDVRGDFSSATLAHDGVVARMDRDPSNGAFRMTFEAPGRPPRVASVVRTVGSRRYQQYLAAEDGALWRLPVAYHIEERRWFPMTAAFLFADASEGDSDGRPTFGGGRFDRHVARWNDNCVFCHNVAPNPGLQRDTGAFASTVAELGIACESCHGPGAEHAARNADPVRRYALHWGTGPDPTIVNPARLSPARAADVCGRCHGQRITDDVAPFLAHGDPFVAGDDLALYSAPLWRDTALAGDRGAFADRFWRDGTPRLTAYEYQGLLQSPCAIQGGLTCTSCHGMHEGDPRGQLRARFAGDGPAADRMCIGCHTALAPATALARHARHDPEGAGARCVGCHMPRVVYGVLDVHRSHRIEVPRPTADRPSACTLCHTTGLPSDAASPLELVFAGDPVTRAVAADALGRTPVTAARDVRAGALAEVMAGDRYPAVRRIAWRALRRLLAPGAAPGTGVAADYNPSADAPVRAASVARLRSGPRGAPPRARRGGGRPRARDRDRPGSGDRRVTSEARRAARFGWTSLAIWAAFGLALETAHGFKLGLYLDDDLRHTLLRLAHAHGVVLALVVLTYGRGVDALFPGDGAAGPTPARVGGALRAGALLAPLGFALSAIRPHEGDPGVAIGLVPLGGLLLVGGLVRVAIATWGRTR